jgi:hypothetical protein
MLRSLKGLEQYAVSASDGEIGSVLNFLLDDQRWAVRYLVVDTGTVLGGPQVLISPISFREADWSTHRFQLALTKDKIQSSPSVEVDKPVSRQHEREYHRHYGYPHYWGFAGTWGMGASPGLLSRGEWADAPVERSQGTSADVHLRSAREVRGFNVQGSDHAIGHVEGFIVDDETWDVRYLVINTSNWWFGKTVLISPQWAKRTRWEDRRIDVEIKRQAVKDSPPWDTSAAVTRAYEARLHAYYGRPEYWSSNAPPGVTQPALDTRRPGPAANPG